MKAQQRVLWFFFLVMALAAQTVFAAKPKGVNRTLLRTEPNARPVWTHTVPSATATELFFVGVSGYGASASVARDEARADAFQQIVKYYGQFIQAASQERSAAAGLASDTLNPYIIAEEEITRFAQAVVQQVAADKYFTEVYLNNTSKKEELVIYVLCSLPRKKAEADMANFTKNVSDRYSNLISPQSTLAGTLQVYGAVYESLQKNPLHRAVAYYDGPNGRVGLFEYCAIQMNAIADTVSFKDLDAQSVEKGETLTATVALSSTQFRTIGAVSCRVRLVGSGTDAVTTYTVGQNNTFSLQIQNTDRLNGGKHTVQLELLLGELASGVQRNPRTGFSFDIRSLNTARVVLLGDGAEGLGGPVRKIVQDSGFLLVETDAAYLITAELEANEGRSSGGNYITLQPKVAITVERERDGTPVVTWSKNYPLVRRATREETYALAYRSIEADLPKEFAEKMKGVAK